MACGPTACGPTACGPTACGPTACGPTACGPTACGPTACGPTACGPTACGPTACGPTASRAPPPSRATRSAAAGTRGSCSSTSIRARCRPRRTTPRWIPTKARPSTARRTRSATLGTAALEESASSRSRAAAPTAAAWASTPTHLPGGRAANATTPASAGCRPASWRGPTRTASTYRSRCAGPGSSIPEITKRFCSSQGDQVVINVPGVCVTNATETGVCDGVDATGSIFGCATSTSTTQPRTHYDEVITVYLSNPIAVCG